MNRIDGDFVVGGTFKAGAIVLPNNSVGNNHVTPSNPLDADKVVQQIRAQYAQNHGSAVAAQRRTIHTAWAAGTLEAFRANLSVACIGDSTISVNLYKNGVTILSTDIDFSSSNAAYDVLEGTFSATPYVTDDVFEVVVTVSAGSGTLGQGLHVDLITREAAE